jgi:hypothetical protein
MNNDIRLYGNGFNPEVLKDLNSLNEKIEKEKDPEVEMKLRLQRLYRGMELNTGLTNRPYGGYYPY